jgi:hypothetical protein
MPLVEPVTSAVRPASAFLVVKASDLIAMFMAVASCLRANGWLSFARTLAGARRHGQC